MTVRKKHARTSLTFVLIVHADEPRNNELARPECGQCQLGIRRQACTTLANDGVTVHLADEDDHTHVNFSLTYTSLVTLECITMICFRELLLAKCLPTCIGSWLPPRSINDLLQTVGL